MTPTERSIKFREREFKGSRLRCLLLTTDKAGSVADFLNLLVAPHATVTAQDHWAPRGLREPGEARLGETSGFLNEADRDNLTRWWLAEPARANTPNWDLVSTCRINDRSGLILVEAKAHEGEFADDRCGATNASNLKQIESALSEATMAWNGLTPGFALSAASHYQLSNRFAFAWKLADMRVPVVLVYLGFLQALEMQHDNRILLSSAAQWRDRVLAESAGTVPSAAWGQTFDVKGTPLTVLIRSAVVGIDARLASTDISS